MRTPREYSYEACMAASKALDAFIALEVQGTGPAIPKVTPERIEASRVAQEELTQARQLAESARRRMLRAWGKSDGQQRK